LQRLRECATGRPTTFCSSRCSNGWSVNNSCPFFVLKMQHLVHMLLKTVLSLSKRLQD
jgi:hypothetical protein